MATPMLNREMSRKNSYKLKKIEELKKGERIPIVSDTMFHVMLNNSSRKQYSAYLIALVLNLDYEKVYDSLIFVNNKLDREKYKDSGKTVDFVCRLNGKIIGIELNNNSSKASLERNISYAADLYKSKMVSGKEYDYETVIQININNFTFEGNSKIKEEYSLRNEEGEKLTEKLKFIHIYLPNIRKKCYNKEKLNVLERLLLAFNEEENLSDITKGDRIMEEYVKESIKASMDEEVIGLYDKELHLEKLRLSELKEAREKGIEQGIEKGIEQGIEKGIEQGIEEEKLEIAKELLNNNVQVDIIMKSTGLTKEEINNLK